ncbi:MAG: class I SAM-dependent methyltransferase family protein [Aigarchaeota archaeon]|nr:class I SAM-dependent methyltransferase family protein [Candidatus Pelearchaeum maunauluense]
MLKLPKARLIGDVAVVRIPAELEEHEKEIGEEILRRNPSIRTVIRTFGAYGQTRTTRTKIIAGEDNTETIYKEHGCIYKLDVATLLFCLGNLYERRRMASIVKAGEVVADMFAGVGQFTIPIAKLASPSVVYAFEINPDAYRYLLENIRLNKLEHVVRAFMDDCRNALKYGMEESADRVIMGYFPGTIRFLPTALRLSRGVGSCIHLHDLARKKTGWAELWESVKNVAEQLGYGVKLIGYREVKSYSPSLAHWALDFRVDCSPQAVRRANAPPR